LTPLRPSPGFSEKIGEVSIYSLYLVSILTLVSGSTDYNGSPKRKKRVSESPLKNGLRGSLASISSLRPYAQSRGQATRTATTPGLIGQQIAPWPTLIQSLSPLKESPPSTKKTKATPPSTYRKTHKRTMTPGPEPELDPIFLPLGPPKARVTSSAIRISTSPSPKGQHDAYGTIRAPSSLTFGSRSTSSRPESIDEMGLLVPGPVFTSSTSSTSSRKRSSFTLLSDSRSTKGSRGSQGSVRSSRGVPIPPEARKVLGMGGTMGGSDASGYEVPELDASDPDSDVPDELRIILAGGSHSDRDSVGDTFSFPNEEEVFHRAFTASPDSQSEEELPVARSAASPFLDLPVFRASLIDEDEHLADLDEGGNTSEEDNTKKSFDFTGELKKLNESGASDRRSFVEQLENAFKTPAKVDLRYDFGAHLKGGMLHVEVPPVPKIPVELSTALSTDDSSYGSSGFDSLQGSRSRIIDMKEPTMLQSTRAEQTFETGSGSQFDAYTTSRIVDVVEPSLLLGPNSFSTNHTHEVIIAPESPPSLNNSLALSTNSAVSTRSDGELNTSFRFGGRRNSESPDVESEKPLTLSDIIPSPSHARSLSNSSLMDENDSVFKSILAKAVNLPQRPSVDTDKKQDDGDARRNSWKTLTRPSSGISFGGLDSFEEVRRGFEFNDNRPAFYPAPTTRRAHRAHDSVFSIASVSSYGRVLNAGSSDPFDYGLPSLLERPSCEDMSISMSITVDDTFSFLNHQPRRRIDSDASSFYFQAPVPQAGGQPFSRGHRRHESNLSISSQGPPISRYNRSYGTHHRRNDSNTSASSVAISYAMHGATGGRATWARHRQESSVDSAMSDFSAMHLGRPGLGDKMFERDNQMPLSAILASPCESVFAQAQRNGNRSSFDYDSIIDHGEGGSNEDSLFDRSDYRSSMSSDLFGNDFSQPNERGLLPSGQFRPLSIISMHSVHGPMKEDDTMISVSFLLFSFCYS
jgi:serine/arginine repetitive matrix protein 2